MVPPLPELRLPKVKHAVMQIPKIELLKSTTLGTAASIASPSLCHCVASLAASGLLD